MSATNQEAAMTTAALRFPSAAKLAAMYTSVGLPCEIEAGRVGLVVYGRTAEEVRSVAKGLAKAPRSLGVTVAVERVTQETDEPEETQFSAVVRFDWVAFEAATAVRQ
jgi:ABC-type sugar transport system substrate-binding protein